MGFPKGDITKPRILQKACVVAAQRLRKQKDKHPRLTVQISMRVLGRVRWSCGADGGAPAQTINLFLCPTINNPFFARPDYKNLNTVLDYPFEQIAHQLSEDGLEVPLSLKVLYEVYHELLAEYP